MMGEEADDGDVRMRLGGRDVALTVTHEQVAIARSCGASWSSPSPGAPGPSWRSTCCRVGWPGSG